VLLCKVPPVEVVVLGSPALELELVPEAELEAEVEAKLELGVPVALPVSTVDGTT
jgi:hypothetical protein